MKLQYIIPAFCILFLAACQKPKPIIESKSVEEVAEVIQDDCQADLTCFLKSVEAAMLRHDKAMMLEFMADGYRIEQHDTYLEGRTDQFLSEFLCGDCSITNTFSCPQFDQIREVKQLTLDASEDEAVVQYRITTPEHKVTADFFVFLRIEDGKRVFRLVGAVG